VCLFNKQNYQTRRIRRLWSGACGQTFSETLQFHDADPDWWVRVLVDGRQDHGVFDVWIHELELLEKRGALERLAHRSAGERREHGHNLVPVLRHAVAHDPVGRELEAGLDHLEFFEFDLCKERACQRAVVLQRTDGLHRDDRLAVGVEYVCQLVDEHGLELQRRQVLDK
jgi:hypothetical protein